MFRPDQMIRPEMMGFGEPRCPSLERAAMECERKILDEARRIHVTICHPKCMFSRCCGKVGRSVMNCEVVKKHQAQTGDVP